MIYPRVSPADEAFPNHEKHNHHWWKCNIACVRCRPAVSASDLENSPRTTVLSISRNDDVDLPCPRLREHHGSGIQELVPCLFSCWTCVKFDRRVIMAENQ